MEKTSIVPKAKTPALLRGFKFIELTDKPGSVPIKKSDNHSSRP